MSLNCYFFFEMKFVFEVNGVQNSSFVCAVFVL